MKLSDSWKDLLQGWGVEWKFLHIITSGICFLYQLFRWGILPNETLLHYSRRRSHANPPWLDCTPKIYTPRTTQSKSRAKPRICCDAKYLLAQNFSAPKWSTETRLSWPIVSAGASASLKLIQNLTVLIPYPQYGVCHIIRSSAFILEGVDF